MQLDNRPRFVYDSSMVKNGFKPKYTITAKLLANIKRITSLITDLNRRHLQKNVVVVLERQARELSTFTSTSIEGNPLPLTEVKRILKNHPKNLRDTEKEIVNYNQALKELNQLIFQGKVTLDINLVQKIQKMVTKGLLSSARCGRLRQEPVFVNDPRSGQTIYWPPDQAEVKTLLIELLDFIRSNQERVDPLILAGIFHKQFVIIHPFMDGNGRSARLATKILLASMGLNTFNLFSFENYYNRNVGKYFSQVGIAGNYYDEKDKVSFTAWLEYFTDGIIDELLRVGKLMQAAVAEGEEPLLPHLRQILDYIVKHQHITDKEYAKITKRKKATRNVDFNKLIARGLIVKKGKGKATYYVATAT
ncbi:MAG: Fic family protein [Candidatus Margulisiibacteriota bacterium]